MVKNIKFRNKNIVYRDKGSGKPVIFLHGYLECSQVWDEFTSGLPENFRSLAVDLPGHGGSAVYGNEHSMAFMADAVKAVMDAEGINNAMMVGHSMGGYVSLAFVDKYPSSLLAWCLFHSHPFADSEEVINNRKREIKAVSSGKKNMLYPDNVSKMFADFNTGRFSDELQRHKHIASDITAEGIIAVLNGMIKRPSRIHVLERGDVPLLMILGKHDNYIPCEEMKNSIDLPENADLLVLERSGHLGFVEEKAETQKALSSFYMKQLY